MQWLGQRWRGAVVLTTEDASSRSPSQRTGLSFLMTSAVIVIVCLWVAPAQAYFEEAIASWTARVSNLEIGIRRLPCKTPQIVQAYRTDGDILEVDLVRAEADAASGRNSTLVNFVAPGDFNGDLDNFLINLKLLEERVRRALNQLDAIPFCPPLTQPVNVPPGPTGGPVAPPGGGTSNPPSANCPYWIDVATGQHAPTVPAPPGAPTPTAPAGLSGLETEDAYATGQAHSSGTGQNFVYVPCPPPTKQTSMVVQPGGTLYAGVNLGGAFGRSQFKEPVDPSFGLSGPIGGAEIGYEWPVGAWRWGIEGDISGSGISGKTAQNCAVGCGTNNDWLMTFRGKLGYDFDPLTVYGTGGLALGDVNANVGGFPGNSKTMGGWVAGAGLRLPLASLSPSLPAGWEGKLEWLHVDLGSSQLCNPPTCGGTAVIPFSSDVIRLGIDIPLTNLFGGMAASATGSAVAAAPPAPSLGAAQVASLVPTAAASDAKKDVDARIKTGQADPGVQRFTIRFDDRIAALTPGGIRSLDEAVTAIRAGEKVALAIEGCDAAADHSDGSPCARRTMSLRQLLAQRGVASPRRLIVADAQ